MWWLLSDTAAEVVHDASAAVQGAQEQVQEKAQEVQGIFQTLWVLKRL